MDWRLDTALYAMIFSGPVVADAYEAWVALFGSSPQGFQQNQPPSNPGGQAVAAFGAHQVTLATSPGRVDLTIAAVSRPDVKVGTAFVDEGFAYPFIEDRAAPLSVHLQSLGRVARVALISTFASPTASVAESGALMAQALPFLAGRVDESSEDSLFQTNRKRPSENTEHTLNRVCTWQQFTAQFLEISMIQGMSVPEPTTTEIFALTLKADLNNVPYMNGLTSDEIAALTAEYVYETRKIRDEGIAAIAL